MTDILGRKCAIESEMTTLDGLVTCLFVMRRSDTLVVRPTDAALWQAWDAEFHGLTTIIDAVVAQARKLSRKIHGEEAEPEACFDIDTNTTNHQATN